MSELDDRLHEGRETIATLRPPADLWARAVQRSEDGDAAVLDQTIARSRRRPSMWLAVAAVLALLALVGSLALLDDDATVETSPANTDTGPTTTEAPTIVTFAIPFAVDLPSGWTVVENDSFYRLAVGPDTGLPQTKLEFALPEATTVEDAIADIGAAAPSDFVIGDPMGTTVGQRPATCMDVEPVPGGSGAPLFRLRTSNGDAVDRDVTLEPGAGGWVCIVDARGHEGESPLVVLGQAPAGELAAFRAVAEGMLAAIEFDLPVS